MKILITGSTGLLGQALSSRLALRGDVTGLSRHTVSGGSVSHVTCDLLDASRTSDVVRATAPDLVINTQAMSDVDRCEREPSVAHAMNVMTVEHLVRALTQTHAWLIHLSTDYVFDGTKDAPYDESDALHPLNVYGRSKAASERVVLTYARGVVVRTSTLFGPGRMNFCDHLVTRLQARQPVQAFTDQVTSPTYTEDLAEALDALSLALGRAPAETWPRIYHLTNAGGCSRVAFAEQVADLIGASRDLIHKIPIAQQRRPAARPAYSALTSTHGPQVIGRALRSWDDALEAYLAHRR